MLLGIPSFGQFQVMRDDLRGLGAPMMDEFFQVAIAGPHIRLACPNLLAVEPERTEIEGHLALLGQFLFRSRIF